MSKFDKLYAKFCRRPIPNDMTFEEIEIIAKHFGCVVLTGGNHSKKIAHVPSGTVIPIPRHGKNVQEAYIKQLKQIFDSIQEGE